MQGLREAVSETRCCEGLNTGEAISYEKLTEGIQVDMDFQSYSTTLVGDPIPFQVPSYFLVLIKEQTKIAPGRKLNLLEMTS